MYYGIKFYGKFIEQKHDLFYVAAISAFVLLGFLFGVLMILDAFNLSPLKREKSESHKIIDGDLEQEFLYPDAPDADFSTIFRTKLGLCYVMKDRIVLVSDVSEIYPENKVIERDTRPILIIFIILGLVLIVFSINSFLHGEVVPSFIFAGLGVYFIIKMILSFKNSATPIIPRSRIEDFKFTKALPFLTRGYFSVLYLDQYGRRKKRLIILPGIFNEGAIEAKKAVEILRAEGFMS